MLWAGAQTEAPGFLLFSQLAQETRAWGIGGPEAAPASCFSSSRQGKPCCRGVIRHHV